MTAAASEQAGPTHERIHNFTAEVAVPEPRFGREEVFKMERDFTPIVKEATSHKVYVEEPKAQVVYMPAQTSNSPKKVVKKPISGG